MAVSPGQMKEGIARPGRRRAFLLQVKVVAQILICRISDFSRQPCVLLAPLNFLPPRGPNFNRTTDL
jgi:hypothetical protein